jgi:hypothetical protein
VESFKHQNLTQILQSLTEPASNKSFNQYVSGFDRIRTITTATFLNKRIQKKEIHRRTNGVGFKPQELNRVDELSGSIHTFSGEVGEEDEDHASFVFSQQNIREF